MMAFKQVFNIPFVCGRQVVGDVRLMSSNLKLQGLNAEMFNQVKAPLPSVQRFFTETIPKMGWTSGENETVMDVGCGTGMLTTQWVAPLFRSLNKIVAIDVLPKMVEQAIQHHPHPKVEYKVASIEDWSTHKEWEGQLTKLISVVCFQWLADQQAAFKNAYKLLKPGGEAAFFFILNSTFFTCIQTISRDSKWSIYFQDVDRFVPKSQLQQYGESHYKKIVEAEGFAVSHIAAISALDQLPDDEYSNIFKSMCVLVDCVPPELQEELMHEFVQYLLMENDAVDGELPVMRSTMLELFVKKN